MSAVHDDFAFPLRLRLRLFGLRMRNRWWRLVAPYKLAPEELNGYDGEPPTFVRADLAATPQEAAEYLARSNEMPLDEYARHMRPIDAMELVWMAEREMCPASYTDDGCEDDDCELSHDEGWLFVLPEWKPGAVRYWRWDW